MSQVSWKNGELGIGYVGIRQKLAQGFGNFFYVIFLTQFGKKKRYLYFQLKWLWLWHPSGFYTLTKVPCSPSCSKFPPRSARCPGSWQVQKGPQGPLKCPWHLRTKKLLLVLRKEAVETSLVLLERLWNIWSAMSLFSSEFHQLW